jgi:hypothetical protein
MPTLDPHGHARRLARAAVAYRHACGCGPSRDPAGELLVLCALVDALAAADPSPLTEGDDHAG